MTMATDLQDMQIDSQEVDVEVDVEDEQQIEQATPPSDVFMAPSVHKAKVLAGSSYSHFSAIPQRVASDPTTECVLGVDEAGRGPVLGTSSSHLIPCLQHTSADHASAGPMVYALFYLPLDMHHSLLADTHHFDDSKVLKPEVRSDLMRTLCTPGTDLHTAGGWATRSLSAQDISAHMLAPNQYNLNAQAMDATIDLIKGVLERGVNVTEIYIDTIGRPDVYQRKLERIWPTIRITVAKKADSLYPVVSAASVCAKVTRDAALDVAYEPFHGVADTDGAPIKVAWGSGYPGDARTTSWLKQNFDPVFGWGNECRYSWSTTKDLLEGKKAQLTVDWPLPDDGNGMRMTDFFAGKNEGGGDELVDWFGQRVTEEMEVF
jgi:ribonuclease H2 subunit A